MFYPDVFVVFSDIQKIFLFSSEKKEFLRCVTLKSGYK